MYNECQSATRMSAERGNGWLAKLWCVLHHTLPYDAEKSTRVVGLCLALSNYILDHCPVVDDILQTDIPEEPTEALEGDQEVLDAENAPSGQRNAATL